MQIDFSNFFIAVSIVQAIVLSVFLLLPDNIKRTSNQLLVIILVSIAAEYAELFIYGTGTTIKHPNYAYLGTLLSVIQPPAIYLYTKSLMYRDFKIKTRHAFLLLPFFIAILVFSFSYYIQPIEIKWEIILKQDLPGMPTSLWLAVAIHSLFLFYLGFAIRSLNKFAASVKAIFSDIENKQITWLRLLLTGYVFIWVISLAYCLSFYIFKHAAETKHVLIFAGISGFIFINTLVIYALKQPVIFSGLTEEESAIIEDDTTTSEIINLPSSEQIGRLESLMDTQKPYLNSNLTINKLAAQSGIPTRELSFIINQGFGKNFFDFICDYRINYAKALLEKTSEKRAILEIMYDAGFNSKSVFNTAFKQKTGLTPSQYRNTAQKGS